jgi:hypothetical protein
LTICAKLICQTKIHQNMVDLFLIDRTFCIIYDQSSTASISNINTFRHVSPTRLFLSLLFFVVVPYLVSHSTSLIIIRKEQLITLKSKSDKKESNSSPEINLFIIIILWRIHLTICVMFLIPIYFVFLHLFSMELHDHYLVAEHWSTISIYIAIGY